jgi:hypothetical protein
VAAWLFPYSDGKHTSDIQHHCDVPLIYETTIPIGNAIAYVLCSGWVSYNSAADHTRSPCRELRLCIERP